MVNVTPLVCISIMLHLTCSEVSLPFSDNKVAGIAFDRQALNLNMDTFTTGTYVIYKDWYEKTYGRCPPKTCYNCAGACNPYRKEKLVVELDDGSQIATVVNQGLIELNGYKLKANFRLIIGWSPSPADPTAKPRNYLGIGYRDDPFRENILTPLFSNHIISEKAVSICSPGLARTFSGVLTFGSIQEQQCRTTTPLKLFPAKSIGPFFKTALVSLGLADSRGQGVTLMVSRGAALYDTESYYVGYPEALFERLLDGMRDMFARAHHPFGWRYDSRKDERYIRQTSYKYLPSLAFNVSDHKNVETIFIPPSHYTEDCDGTWCLLLLRPHSSAEVVLGRPFFTSHFSTFSETASGQRSVSD